MRKTTRKLLTASILTFIMFITGPALAEDTSHGGHAGHGAPPATGHSGKSEIDHSQHAGANIRNAEVNGYKIAYHLMAMKNPASTPMPEMKSHHLMIYVLDANGKAVTNAQTGFLVVGPDKASQKVMAMAMGGGFGADLDFKQGAYTITTKLMIGATKVVDEFAYKAP